MSRCFSFPPPGYLRNTDTLIEESIKIQLDTEKPIKDRKEKKDKKDRNETKEERKLRKEKKRERKEKRKREKEETKKDSKLKLTNEVKEPKDIGKLQKGEYYENEHFEKSDITQELDKPVSSPQEPYSSDSSQSSKRKRDTLLPSKDHGTGIRIRLPLRKHREPEEVKKGFQLGSSSRSVGISDSIIQKTKRVQRPLQGITKVENPNQLPVSSASCRLPLKNVETPNELAGISTSQICRPLLKKVENHSSSQVCRAPSKKVETLLPVNCRPPVKKVENLQCGPVKKVETLQLGNSAVCRPPLNKVETLLPVSKVCRPPLRKDDTPNPPPVISASKVCRPPLRKDDTPNQAPVISASKVCRPPLPKKDETLNQPSVISASKVCRPPLPKKGETPNQPPVISASKVCRPPLSKIDETPSQLKVVCKPLNNSIVDAPSKPLVPVDAPTASTANETVDEESLRMESLYNSLLKIPLVTYDCFDAVDQDWLFSSALTESKSVSKKQKIDDAIPCSKFQWPPRAQYMPEVEVYALPYTVPF
ncbi:uncharacterized protein LOC127093448 [Lathyrus oleraceus]|uniref:Uncharacterized protein n=1 Tax=Pisum sativum TaxID=3888 RepID=A0A9D5A4N3_PEA|nr:uncharacterized protein LOC127093448 [Pisum sativum]KAI5392750.1 hypothetical protein KIW84_060063 [Pisum sativum]